MMEIDPVEFLAVLERALQGLDNDFQAHILNGLAEPVADADLQPVEQWLRQNRAIEAQFPHAAQFLLASREERRRLVREAGGGVGAGPLPDGVGGVHIPGEFVGDVLEEEQAAQPSDEAGEDEDTDEEGEAVSTQCPRGVHTLAQADCSQAPILPVRLARGIMNIFWGRRAAAPEESSEDDDEDLPPQQASDVD
jgi:hypothetical protein